MPKIDPITGCTVMTLPEFFASEAEAEGRGRTGADIMEEMFDDMESERVREEERMRDPQMALQFVNEVADEWNAPRARKVLAVVHARHDFNMSSSSSDLTAIAERWSGRGTVLDVVDIGTSDWSGTRLEPPEHETFIRWRSLPEE